MNELGNDSFREQMKQILIDFSTPTAKEKIPMWPSAIRQVIQTLQKENIELKQRLQITEIVSKRICDGLIDSKYEEIDKLINNPIITLPSGRQLLFSDLNSEQLEYLESLSKYMAKK